MALTTGEGARDNGPHKKDQIILAQAQPAPAQPTQDARRNLEAERLRFEREFEEQKVAEEKAIIKSWVDGTNERDKHLLDPETVKRIVTMPQSRTSYGYKAGDGVTYEIYGTTNRGAGGEGLNIIIALNKEGVTMTRHQADPLWLIYIPEYTTREEHDEIIRFYKEQLGRQLDRFLVLRKKLGNKLVYDDTKKEFSYTLNDPDYERFHMVKRIVDVKLSGSDLNEGEVLIFGEIFPLSSVTPEEVHKRLVIKSEPERKE